MSIFSETRKMRVESVKAESPLQNHPIHYDVSLVPLENDAQNLEQQAFPVRITQWGGKLEGPLPQVGEEVEVKALKFQWKRVEGEDQKIIHLQGLKHIKPAA